MKTKEELNKLKEEVEAVNEKLQELTEEELEQVNGGDHGSWLQQISGTAPKTLLEHETAQHIYLPHMIMGKDADFE